MRKLEISKNMKFGRLTVIKEVENHRTPSGQTKRKIKCRCNCGTKVEVLLASLIRGNTKSCGCYQIELVKEKGRLKSEKSGNKHPYYNTYSNMLKRCYNEDNPDYKRWGGRGIKVCKRWRRGDGKKSGLLCFVEDMGEKPDKSYTLDRINNNGNYEPNNCRWVSRKENCRNTRQNRFIKYKGERFTLGQIVEKYGVRGLNPQALWSRLNLGWGIKEALTTPVKKYRINF
jgi:hypothetical protein